ncbi:hypothetical protein QKU48_gp0212 [Fadolivirus algeromassiliense]|jgi:hypothetical protein|uniref:SWIB/MDM2 domain-containing protein n=1 Tax=Fadolivirus FV1/VV64 TaxID=3070911 RepID=A0A7D3USN6_9VIRU|nr:hypothetical protein QKU48_gp0212 [Fadolivirus algeromassiliense]QKF93670.1 hypothetical protein Fadolivirus_1_212 [Fadolivirus FV1/VV64]
MSNLPKKPVKKSAVKKTSVVNPIVPQNNVNQDQIDYNQEITKLLQTKCKHHEYSYYGYGYQNTEVCTSLCNYIIEYYGLEVNKQEDRKLTADTIKGFLEYITKNGYQYYYHSNGLKHRCIAHNNDLISNALAFVFRDYFPEVGIFTELLKFNVYDTCYKNLLENAITKLPDQYITAIVNERLKYSCNADDGELIKFLMDNIEYTSNTLKQLCMCRNEPLSHLVAGIISKSNDELPDDLLDVACESLPYTKNIVLALINRGYKLTSDHLNIVCGKCDIDAINFILQTGRFPVTKEHFQSIVTSKCFSKEIYDNKNKDTGYYRHSTVQDPWVLGYSADKFELIVKYGYKPDYDDVLYSIKHKVEIPGIERFGIELDKTLLEKCWDVDFYPTYKFNCIEPEMVELQKLCKTKKMKDMRHLVKTHNLVPDRKCMENASCYKNNNQIYDYLANNGGKTTYKCLKNCAKELNNNTFIVNLLNKYEVTLNEEMENYKNRIKELEAQIVELGGTIKPQQQLKSNVIQKTIDVDIDDDIPDNDEEDDDNHINTENNTSSNKIVNKVDDDDISDNDLESDDFVVHVKNKTVGKKPKPAAKKAAKQKSAKIQNSENDNIKQDDKVIDTLDLPIDAVKISEIQKQYRLKSIPNNKLIDVFKLDKTKKLSYSDVKKYLLDKIKTDGWLDANDKNLINLPQDIRDKLNLNKNGSVKFNDIDKLICMFYN